MVAALDGVRVLELAPTRQSAYATRMLADMGARVTLVEPPPGAELAAARFEHELDRITFHARKQSVVLDIERPEARPLLARLVEDTDVVVRSVDEATAERFGIDEGTLRALNARLVYAVCSGFGPLGELADAPGADLNAQGAGGFMARSGFEGDPPMPAGAAIASSTGAMYLCSGILAALVHAGRTGVGERVDVSLLGAQIGIQSWELDSQSVRGIVSPRIGRGHPDISEYTLCHVFEAKDGWISLAGMGSPRWERLCGLLGLPELQEQFMPYGDQAQWTVTMAHVLEVLGEHFLQRTRAEWLEAFERVGVTGGAAQTHAEILVEPQAHANGYITEMDHPTLGTITVVGSPFVHGAEPAGAPPPPPAPGADTERRLQEVGVAAAEIAALREQGVLS
jgi:CoA:oxalate CoA-transferase